MFCSKCGSEVKDGVNFCPKCGAQLGTKGGARKKLAMGNVMEKRL